ncbi:unknown similar to AMEV141 [Mythimna separata entomopoxvirus 'L']|uniref:Uncharacterized protein n=1 Tax=Mythimna separata entomopoxvirus 'L' TaxID=1293572 RepID=A0A916P7J5_9POXV|nr:unknown similar to AMEV141 [Mythimna separata entomopoxvirus 'L']CCU56381.1 unknown similar to AMEV141 [Mythimna separata entomopoxvirus 'L']
MQNGLIVGLVITGVLILYVGVLIGIIYLSIMPYSTSIAYNLSDITPTSTKIIYPPNTMNNDIQYDNNNNCDNIIKENDVNNNDVMDNLLLQNNQLEFSSEHMPINDKNDNKIIIKNRRNRNKLDCNEFNDIYCKSSMLNTINTICIDRNLYISTHFTDRLPIQHAVQNINLAIMKKSDILFVSNANVKYEDKVIRYNDNIKINFPRINIDNDNLYTESELSGYYTYSSYIESDNSQLFIGANTDSIFIQDPSARTEIYDKKTDSDGYFISIPIRITSGKFAGQKLRLINVYKMFDPIDKYVSLRTFKIVQYLFDMIYENFSNDLIIIGGYFGLRNELIQLAINKANLDKKLILFPSNNIVTVSNFDGCSNPDAIIIDKQLISECTNVKIITSDPWLYDNNNNYILTVVLENFKDKNYENSKEIARSNWNRLHSTNNNIYPPLYKIPIDFVNSEKEDYNIRNNPIYTTNN